MRFGVGNLNIFEDFQRGNELESLELKMWSCDRLGGAGIQATTTFLSI